MSVGRAEYKTATEAARSLLYYRNLLVELGFPVPAPSLSVDNQGVIQASSNPAYSGRLKHLAVLHHFIKSVVSDKRILLQKVPSSENIADLLTKPLSRRPHLVAMKRVVSDLRRVWGP